MAFDVVSFLAGVAAGALTAGLAGFLHSLERMADVQERLRLATKKADQLKSLFSASGADDSDSDKMDELRRELDEIHEDIKRMYKRTTR
jgi:uncharacterized membrane protein (DUF106 family)